MRNQCATINAIKFLTSKGHLSQHQRLSGSIQCHLSVSKSSPKMEEIPEHP